MRDLIAAASACARWQEQEHEAGRDTGARCLEAVRAALKTQSLGLPVSEQDYAGAFAISCGDRLAMGPAQWGWKPIGASSKQLPMDKPGLVFFRKCGLLTAGPHKGQCAGHIAIWKPTTYHLVANITYEWSAYWASRLAYIFVPAA